MEDQLIDQVLHDRYHIQSLLSRQTGRRTYLARDTKTELAVVIKLLLFGVDFVWDDLKLFEREAAVLRELEHPAIPQYLDYFDVETALGKGFALVQTYLKAKSLQEWVQSGRTFTEADLKTIAQSLLGVLNYLHHRQPRVVHRDIKPSNILLGDRSGNSLGPVYLVDFGSVQAGRHEGTRTIVGTYGYMPPEQFGGQTTPASDLYALGATIIYLATGQHPDQFPQRDLRIQFESHANLSPYLVSWLQWLTEPSWERRMQSAQLALIALTDNVLTDCLANTQQPTGSNIKIRKTSQSLEIRIPPHRFSADLVNLFLATIALLFMLILPSLMIMIENPTLLFPGGIFFIAATSAVLICFISAMLFHLFGFIQLHITQAKISLSSETFGLSPSGVRTAARKDISSVELTLHSYAIHPDGNVAIPPQINIWAGTTHFKLGSDQYLTYPEIQWLAHEITAWLDMPLTKGTVLPR